MTLPRLLLRLQRAISYLPLTHGVTMGYIPFGASPRLCSKPFTDVQCLEVLACDLRPAITRNRLLVYNVLKYYLAVFAPPLPVTSTVVHCHEMSSKRAKGTIFLKSAPFARASYKGKTHARKCKAAKTNNTKIH